MSADPLKAIGLDVDSFDIVVVKHRVHHKAYWEIWSKVDHRSHKYTNDTKQLGKIDFLNILFE